MNKKIVISIFFIIMLFVFTGCGYEYGTMQGTVVDKNFTPAHTTNTYIAHRVGKTMISTPMTQYHKDTWRIKIQKEEDNKIKECWVSIREEKYNQIQIGDYYSEEE